MTDATGSTEPIAEVREGMTVFDSSGEKVGTVRDVQMGDPQAVTAQGQGGGGENGNVVTYLAEAFRPGSLDDTVRERLARLGFVRIDSSGLFHRDRYTTSDEIAAVEDDAVHLSVPGDQLIH
ncbi:PRC-barrel domain-containing protein [Ruania alkalisoli]|uniref:PRC-barrel domain-containing protein n=1 Tax=Ruania alkalisoli TaxID=2779775 RepID=A0A7M1SU06_9MICO|nr:MULTISPECIES: PRC-barrel domain-containing protein [Ruania]QOR70103.1 PRC-barrel domain-containing protein [Ruania alkalisoli]